MVTRLGLDDVNGAFSKLQARFAGTRLTIKLYPPKRPRVPDLPMVTYDMSYKSIFASGSRGFIPDFIKLEVLSENVAIPTNKIKEKTTPVLTVRNVTCVTLGALVADKLQTLASKTVGTVVEEMPKQLYDINHLLFDNAVSKEAVEHMMYAFDALAKEELKFKKLKGTPSDVLGDVIATLADLSTVDIAGKDDFKRATRDFQSLYVRKENVRNTYGWGETASRIRFAAGLLKLALDDEIEESEYVKCMAKAKSLSNALPPAEKNIEMKLIELIGEDGRKFRGKPLRRIYWQAVDYFNIDKLAGAI